MAIAASAAPNSPENLRPRLERMLASGMFPAALPLAERYAELCPADPAAWTLLGVALRGSGRPAPAIAAYRRALDLMPDAAGVLSNLGNALKDLQRYDEAVAAHYRAVQFEPKSISTWLNLAVTLRERGDITDSIGALEHVLHIDPEHVVAHSDRAQLHLMLGDYAKGWPEFEWRWKLPELKPPPFKQPRWQGEEARDKTILLWPEQGFGDTILGARYVTQVKERAGRIVVGCQPELVRLFRTIQGVDQIVAVGETVPPFDAHCPLMSLPGIFATSTDNVPPPVHFTVPPASHAKLATAIGDAGDRLKVGIVWSGNINFRSNPRRAATLERFLSFGEIPGVQLYSLQKGPRAADLDAAGARGIVTDLAPALDDFADTAAAIDHLDLIVMTDSAVAHLAGARSKPVWNLLAFTPYWLYLRDRSDSPWYPSMRLFRQPRPGDWESVFYDVRAALAELCGGRS
jgi:hypothetical protein